MVKKELFDFNKFSNLDEWDIVDDVVMGGRSSGEFKIDKDGNGLFYGEVSTANNGGFSSVRHSIDRLDVTPYSKVILKLKGDGKSYQFRLKSRQDDRHSYVYSFNTTGNWETIEINFDEFEPQFRGRKLDMSNFEGNEIEEIAFLIGNKKDESFMLAIDHIFVE